MSDTTSPTETPMPLEIPDEAARAAVDAYRLMSAYRPAGVAAAVAAAAPLIVAAELRRLANKIEGELLELVENVGPDADFDNGILDVMRELQARADELSA